MTNVTGLQFGMVRPEKVPVDEKISLRLDKFRLGMGQVGLIVWTASWSMSLNLLGPQEMAESTGYFWTLLMEFYNMDFLPDWKRISKRQLDSGAAVGRHPAKHWRDRLHHGDYGRRFERVADTI